MEWYSRLVNTEKKIDRLKRAYAELESGKVPVTTLRAAVIIGSGSASYEIIYHLVRKVPLILVPYWATTKCQPVAIRDVIKYLVGVLEIPETAGKIFDIGGQDVLTYESMLRVLALMSAKITAPSFRKHGISSDRAFSPRAWSLNSAST